MRKFLDSAWMGGLVWLLAISSITTIACTENSRAKNWGGTAKYCLDPGEKLVNVTWKEGGSLWLLTRPAHEGEKPELLKFQEQSSFGVMQGTVVITERAVGDKSDCK